jgi:hypothetical protein
MSLSKFKLVCVVALAGILNSCIGAGIAKPGKCAFDWPTVGMFDDPTYNIIRSFNKHEATGSSKDDFMREWGKPDKIHSTENIETWTYDRNIWCGVVPCFILCVPLVLPVCNGVDMLTFVGDKAILLDSKKTFFYGFVFPVGPQFDDSPQCYRMDSHKRTQ